MVNKKKIKLLNYCDLTNNQIRFYDEAYKILKNSVYIENINKGERITAYFALAHCVHYYMSDDNKTSPYIRKMTSVEVVNFCGLPYIELILKRKNKKVTNVIIELEAIYKKYILLYDNDKIPKRLINENMKTRTFPKIMARCKMKFDKHRIL